MYNRNVGRALDCETVTAIPPLPVSTVNTAAAAAAAPPLFSTRRFFNALSLAVIYIFVLLSSPAAMLTASLYMI